MTAVSLLDFLTKDRQSDLDPHVAQFAERIVDSSLAEWQRVLEYEDHFSSEEYQRPGIEDEVERLLYGIYQEWAREADAVLKRTRKLQAAGHVIANAEALEDADGHASASLKITPEMTARAMEQVRQGMAIPTQELRNELRSRIRA